MKVLSFGEILLRLASPGYTKLFQKDSLQTIRVQEGSYYIAREHQCKPQRMERNDL